MLFMLSLMSYCCGRTPLAVLPCQPRPRTVTICTLNAYSFGKYGAAEFSMYTLSRLKRNNGHKQMSVDASYQCHPLQKA